MEELISDITTIDLVDRLIEAQSLNNQKYINLYAYELAKRACSKEDYKFYKILKDFGYKKENQNKEDLYK